MGEYAALIARLRADGNSGRQIFWMRTREDMVAAAAALEKLTAERDELRKAIGRHQTWAKSMHDDPINAAGMPWDRELWAALAAPDEGGE